MTRKITLDFPEGMTMTLEGRSCNARNIEGSSVGAMFFGEEGSILITGGNSYKVFDLSGKEIKSVENEDKVDPRNPSSPAQQLDALHIQNFFDGIKNGTEVRSNIESGHKSVLLMQLGNIAQRVGHSLEINPENGHIVGDKDARKLWSREYEKGWEMKL